MGWCIRRCGNSPLQIFVSSVRVPSKVPPSEYQKSWHLVISEKICILKEDKVVNSGFSFCSLLQPEVK